MADVTKTGEPLLQVKDLSVSFGAGERDEAEVPAG